MIIRPGMLQGAVSIVGPVEDWTPRQTLGPARLPDGRGDSPDPLRPSGTITTPCPNCRGAGTRQHKGTNDAVPCSRCKGIPGGTADVSWRTSSRDRQSHVFHEVGELAEALCTHTVPRALLTESPGARACMDCTMELVGLLNVHTDADEEQWRTDLG